MSKFVHLHVHTEYSLLDGLCKIDELVKKAQEYKMPAVALTDHGVMYGAIPFYNKMRSAGIKPIIGCEIYLAPRGYQDKEGARDRNYSHLTLLCENNEGYQNLIKLVTRTHLEGYYYKPRADYHLLSQYSKGLICLTGCRKGLVSQNLISDKYEKAKRELLKLAAIFGKDNTFIEIQIFGVKAKDQNYRDSLKLKSEAIKLSKETGIGLVATNDVHYVEAEDAQAQEILLCIQTKETINNPKRKMSMINTPDFYFRSPKEMADLFADVPQALANTINIAERCHLEIKTGKPIFPKFSIPSGKSDRAYLRELTEQGLIQKFGKITPQMAKKVNYELGIIDEKGYNTYFLICWDLAKWTRSQKIPISTRGSVTASLVAYALDITNINPLEHNLPFDRFLNPERPSLPDIDFDIAEDKRQRVIEYIYQKYGRDHAAQIITFGTMEARGAIRDVGRVLDLPYSVPDRIAKLIPPESSIQQAMDSVLELKEEYETDPEIHQLIDIAQKIEGVARHASVHACGLIITPEPLVNYVPLQKEPKGGKGVITQYDMYALDINAVGKSALGLLKLDLLGLRNLTTLRRATQLIEKRQGKSIDIYSLPQDKKEVYRMLSAGHSTGVFQLEGAGMRRLLKDMKPQNFIDLATAIALFRPGPMDLIPNYLAARKNPSLIKYPHPDLKEILEETYGVLIFQEQCMTVVTKMAGYSLGRADVLRRAIGKKSKKLMAEEKKNFIKAAQEQGYTASEAKKVFSYIETFARYGFNKSHTAAYALIAYQTAYLKCFYPVEFMTALFISEQNHTEKIPLIVDECRRLGLNVLPPSINYSQVDFSIEDNSTIRFGLSAVKNVGRNVVEKIVEEREKNGPFKSFSDLVHRTDYRALNRRAMESLIKAGVCDDLGSRPAMLKVCSQFLKMGSEYQKKKQNGQRGLFERSNTNLLAPVKLPQIPDLDPATYLSWERELLGFTFSKDPFEEKLACLANYLTHQIGEITPQELNRQVVIAGVIIKVRRILTKKGNKEMAIITLRDKTGTIEAVIFPTIFSRYSSIIRENQLLIIHGRVDQPDQNREPSIIVQKIKEEKEIGPIPTVNLRDNSIEISVPRAIKRQALLNLKELLENCPGAYSVSLILINGHGRKSKIQLPHKIKFDEEMKNKILNLLTKDIAET
ncbi:DNA polymerase III subunit alpha [candidate division CPR3 bacterium 4484_211]|uniref:DNA polymerase III subunit alpha n=1 Tax=candidate division CPR3 bacterium 4484_211 TaxID=1968527 RepID=A0A1W9NX37_UNCC3|nr:MAG: DNA polymerase III subunit alpha [candidate division CPR3 bacterium 4484_211]